jgi:hypothetical protein
MNSRGERMRKPHVRFDGGNSSARYMKLETIGAVSDTPHVSLSAVTA